MIRIVEIPKLQSRVVDAHWITNPIQEAELQEEMTKNPLLAEAIMRPRTDLLIKSLVDKVRYREHIGIEIKGGKLKDPQPVQENLTSE